MKNITGKVYMFGKNIDTDQIYPGKYLEITEHIQIAAHCLEGARESFPKTFEKGGIVVALENFGCGSSREHAAIALQTIGVSAVIAKSFGRIFYRNAINMGVPLIICNDIEKIVNESDEIEIDFQNCIIKNINTGNVASCERISDYALNILNNGGIKNMIKKQIGLSK